MRRRRFWARCWYPPSATSIFLDSLLARCRTASRWDSKNYLVRTCAPKIPWVIRYAFSRFLHIHTRTAQIGFQCASEGMHAIEPHACAWLAHLGSQIERLRPWISRNFHFPVNFELFSILYRWRSREPGRIPQPSLSVKEKSILPQSIFQH